MLFETAILSKFPPFSTIFPFWRKVNLLKILCVYLLPVKQTKIVHRIRGSFSEIMLACHADGLVQFFDSPLFVLTIYFSVYRTAPINGTENAGRNNIHEFPFFLYSMAKFDKSGKNQKTTRSGSDFWLRWTGGLQDTHLVFFIHHVSKYCL